VGGEEFAVILPACGFGDVQGVCDKLRSVVSAIPPLAGGSVVPLSVTVSVGGTASDGHEDAAAFIQRADSALLIAKRRGRDCSVVLGEGVIGDLDGLE
jgi:diguanylate cyclase